MQIIQKRQRSVEVEYYLVYEWVHTPGAGYSFPCDEGGIIDMSRFISIDGLENLLMCKQNATGDIINKGVVRYENHYTIPAIGRCSCGLEVTLFDPLTNECACGLLYNGSGQDLVARSLWEENYDPE